LEFVPRILEELAIQNEVCCGFAQFFQVNVVTEP